MNFDWWPGRTRPPEKPPPFSYVDQVTRQYATTGMTVEQLERDLEIALDLDDAMRGAPYDYVPRYLKTKDGRYLYDPYPSLLIWTQPGEAASSGRSSA